MKPMMSSLTQELCLEQSSKKEWWASTQSRTQDERLRQNPAWGRASPVYLDKYSFSSDLSFILKSIKRCIT